jgi:hypothetical protein
MENLIDELKEIKKEKNCKLVEASKINRIAKKYDMFTSDVFEVYFNI